MGSSPFRSGIVVPRFTPVGCYKSLSSKCSNLGVTCAKLNLLQGSVSGRAASRSQKLMRKRLYQAKYDFGTFYDNFYVGSHTGLPSLFSLLLVIVGFMLSLLSEPGNKSSKRCYKSAVCVVIIASDFVMTVFNAQVLRRLCT